MKLNAMIRNEILRSIRESMLAGFTPWTPNPDPPGVSSTEYLSLSAQRAAEKKGFIAELDLCCKQIKVCLSLFSTAEDLEDEWPAAAAHIPKWVTNPRGYFDVPKPVS